MAGQACLALQRSSHDEIEPTLPLARIGLPAAGLAVGRRGGSRSAARGRPPAAAPPAAAAPAGDMTVDQALDALDQRGQDLRSFSGNVSLKEQDADTMLGSLRTGQVWYQQRGPGDCADAGDV